MFEIVMPFASTFLCEEHLSDLPSQTSTFNPSIGTSLEQLCSVAFILCPSTFSSNDTDTQSVSQLITAVSLLKSPHVLMPPFSSVQKKQFLLALKTKQMLKKIKKERLLKHVFVFLYFLDGKYD